jgi:hypothetical protein
MKKWPFRTEVEIEETMGTNRHDVGTLLVAGYGRGQKGAAGLMEKYPDKLLKIGGAKNMTNSPDKFLKTKGRSMNPRRTIQMSQ